MTLSFDFFTCALRPAGQVQDTLILEEFYRVIYNFSVTPAYKLQGETESSRY